MKKKYNNSGKPTAEESQTWICIHITLAAQRPQAKEAESGLVNPVGPEPRQQKLPLKRISKAQGKWNSHTKPVKLNSQRLQNL